MSQEALNAPAKESWQLVQFLNAATGSLIVAYTDRDSDYSFEGVDYTSVTAMEIGLPTNNGILDAQPCNIALPLFDDFTTDISSGAAYAPVEVRVIEVVKSEGYSTSYLRTFRGLIVGAKRNVEGRPRFIAISAIPVKARLQTVAMGLQCMHHCINRLGDGRCGITLLTSPKRDQLTILAIDGTKVTVDDADVVAGLEDRFYQRGYMSYGGLEIMVQTWRNEIEGTKADFYLMRRPPTSWLGQTVTIYAGCDKTVETCRSRFNNEDHFNGVGYKMPAYHPSFEDGGELQ